jgi:hypothetical protein
MVIDLRIGYRKSTVVQSRTGIPWSLTCSYPYHHSSPHDSSYMITGVLGVLSLAKDKIGV